MGVLFSRRRQPRGRARTGSGAGRADPFATRSDRVHGLRHAPTRCPPHADTRCLHGAPAGAHRGACVCVAQQYFGGNKVQVRSFEFQVLRTDNFDIYFYEEEREAATIAARMAERWRARLGRVLTHDLSGRQPLILYAAHPHFEQTNAIGGDIGEGTGGVTESIRRRIILPLGGPLADTDHVIGHELVHAFQFDITSPEQGGGRAGLPGAQRLPLWFIEGMAEYLSIGPVDPHTAMWVRDAVLQEKLPRIKDLDNPEVLPVPVGPGVLGVRLGTVGSGDGGPPAA